jgi:hypothetical protein
MSLLGYSAYRCVTDTMVYPDAGPQQSARTVSFVILRPREEHGKALSHAPD